MAAAPLMRESTVLGVISVTSPEPGPLAEKQMALLQTFADQAVIAIENVRLFKELQTRTEALTKSVGQLTALGEVGQAISSTLDLETVLKTIVARAVQLTGLDGGSIYEYDEQAEEYHLRATENYSAEVVEVLRRAPIRRNEGPGLAGGPHGTADPDRGDARRKLPDAAARVPPAHGLPGAPGGAAHAREPYRRRPGGHAEGARAPSRPRSSSCSRPSPPNRRWRFRTRACSARSRRRAGSSRSRASTSPSSSPA